MKLGKETNSILIPEISDMWSFIREVKDLKIDINLTIMLFDDFSRNSITFPKSFVFNII